MMPSRPNGVLNHGTPAYGYRPCGGGVPFGAARLLRVVDPLAAAERSGLPLAFALKGFELLLKAREKLGWG